MTDTTTVSPAKALEALAPYPADGDIEALARWLTVQAHAEMARIANHPWLNTTPEYGPDGKPTGAYLDAIRTFTRDWQLAWSQYAAAYLARARAGQPIDPPDVALRREIDTSEYVAETLDVWLAEYGIDAETVIRIARGEPTEAVTS